MKTLTSVISLALAITYTNANDNLDLCNDICEMKYASNQQNDRTKLNDCYNRCESEYVEKVEETEIEETVKITPQEVVEEKTTHIANYSITYNNTLVHNNTIQPNHTKVYNVSQYFPETIYKETINNIQSNVTNQFDTWDIVKYSTPMLGAFLFGGIVFSTFTGYIMYKYMRKNYVETAWKLTQKINDMEGKTNAVLETTETIVKDLTRKIDHLATIVGNAVENMEASKDHTQVLKVDIPESEVLEVNPFNK